MADYNNTLIICRDLQSVRRLSRFSPHAQSRYILASDDPRVHEAAKKYPWIDKICWIEQMESFYCVADDVIGFLKTINEWLGSLADAQRGIPKEFLYWIQHCEGGMTTQRIQDLLLLIRSYLNLIENNKLTEILIFASPDAHWENDVLCRVAYNRGIEVKIFGKFRLDVSMKIVWSILKPFAIDLYCIFGVIKAKSRCLFFKRHKMEHDKEIVFQLCSSLNKNVLHTYPLMKALKERNYNPVALCWNAFQGARLIRKEGLSAEELDCYVPLSVIVSGYYRMLYTWRETRRKRKEFLNNNILKYRKIPLGPALWPSVIAFMPELPRRYRLQMAARRYFSSHSPVAILPWTMTLPEGVIFVQNALTNIERPLFFASWPFTCFDSPYHVKMEGLDLGLAWGERHKAYLERLQIPLDNIVCVGKESFDNIEVFVEKYTSEGSRRYLNIPLTYSCYILYDAGGVLRGYLTQTEAASIATYLLNFAKKHPSVALIIKPHPSSHDDWIKNMLNTFQLKNAFLISKKNLPFHSLNACDILITKFSTLGLEAMHFSRPVISVLLDWEDRWKIYEDAVEYVYTTDALYSLLERLLDDKTFRKRWTEEYLWKQEHFLRRDVIQTTRKASDLGAEAIDKYIRQRYVHYRRT